MVDVARVASALKGVAADKNNIRKSEWTLTEGTSGEESVVAEYSAPRDLILRDDVPIKVLPVAKETGFTSDGSGGNSETFNLSGDVIESDNTNDLVVYNVDRDVFEQPDSVDYANDSFDYTDSGTGNDLEAYYVSGEVGDIAMYKVAPQSAGRTEERLFDNVTKLLNVRDQNEDPVRLNLNESELQKVVPEDWKLEFRLDAPYTGEFSAQNALLMIPAKYLRSQVQNLSKAVQQDIIERA